MNLGLDYERLVLDSIESAYSFVAKLADAVAESKRDIEIDLQREAGSDFSRRVDALRLVLHNLKKLETHLNIGLRVLNDLRSLRRLLFEERNTNTTDVVRKVWNPFNNDEIVLPFGWSRRRALSSIHQHHPNGGAHAFPTPWYVRTTPQFSIAVTSGVLERKSIPSPG